MTMRTAIYMGDIKHLQGQKAILRNVEPFNPDRVVAQFDNLDAEHNGKKLASGWHEFDQDDFLEYREL